MPLLTISVRYCLNFGANEVTFLIVGNLQMSLTIQKLQTTTFSIEKTYVLKNPNQPGRSIYSIYK